MADHNQVYMFLISRHEQVRASIIKTGQALKKMMFTNSKLPDSLQHKPTLWYGKLMASGFVYSAKDLKGASPFVFYQMNADGIRVPAHYQDGRVLVDPYLVKKYSAFVRLVAKFDKLYNEEKELKAAFASLNRLNLGTRVKWNTGNRIMSVQTEKKYIPVEQFVAATSLKENTHEF